MYILEVDIVPCHTHRVRHKGYEITIAILQEKIH